ncbi:fungal-specific transcription factor domain-containing protein [Boeremia exigua]|uniref:fungal-specific transcription factor domain-containing protein n=1 Tax=Boeremia exigua TaxID=749465 RepID=UPI001E8D6C44|nr:fungal-specific transcription factor domain-containing protein [Boeremia exigua]KAH6625113.1 fungal-specific transcription factor domain-containing protein [Boeremia exigua]
MPAQRRHRSTVACQSCRRRKVRCSVTVTGIPCSNCTQDRTTCTIHEGSHELPRQANLMESQFPHSEEPSNSVTVNESYVSGRDGIRASSSSHANRVHTPRQPVLLAVSKSIDDGFNPARQRDLHEEQSGAELSLAARTKGDSNSGTPFYTGEQPGVTSLIDVHEPLPRHIMLKSNPPRVLSQDDRDFLYRKGALSSLQMYSHQELLLAYFHHVHPGLPILHLSKLLELKSPDAIPTHGMLLYWSMAVVAVNYVPDDVWRTENFTSRKHMKDTLYDRAKCMYDNSGETNKEVLLQSALLLSFWHSESDSHSQPWYWSGAAINWCQIIGLHRDPDTTRLNPHVTPERRNLWRRLWASCLFRDRWLSLTLGRPLRIRLSDCDMPYPVSQDVINDLSMLPVNLQKLWVPKGFDVMVEHWILLIRLSRLLGEILSLFYQQLGRLPTVSQFDALESELSAFVIPELHDTHRNPLATFSYYNLQLHLQATLITLYRPFVSTVPQGLHHGAEESWRARVHRRLETAATQANGFVDCIAREGLVGFATPMTPPLLVPGMHVHLLGCKSDNRLTRRLAFNKLEMCMTIMRELQKTHTSASLFCGIFGEAIRQLMPGPLDETIWGVPQVRRPSTSGTTAPEDAPTININELGAPTLVTDDLLESLLNESSVYNFWESMNMPDQAFIDYGRQ